MIFVFGQLLSARPLIGLRFGFRLGNAVALLNSSNQLIFLAGDGRPVIVCELTPALARRSGELLPFAFDLIPVHMSPSGVWEHVSRQSEKRRNQRFLRAISRDRCPTGAAAGD